MAQPANNVAVVTRGQLRNAGLNRDTYENAMVDHEDELLRGLRGLRSLSISLPSFDGSQLVTDWLEDFDRYSAETDRVRDASKLFDLISHFGKEAKQWFQLLPEATKKNYDQLRAAFKDRFSPTNQELLDVRGAIYTTKQLPNQKFRDFARDIQRQARAINMPEAEVVGVCVNGARPALKPHLAMAKPTTMDELMKLPVVVSDVVEEAEPVQHLFQTLNARFDSLESSVLQTQPQPKKEVRFRDNRSTSRSPSRHRTPSPGPRPREPRRPQQWPNRRHNQYQGPRYPPQSRQGPRYNRPPQFQRSYRPDYQYQQNQPQFQQQQSCSKCGRVCGGNRECPAFGKSCFRCGGRNHFRHMCRSRINQYNGQ